MARATPPARAEKCPWLKHHQAVGHNTHDDRRHAVEHVRGEADQVAEAGPTSVFREINSRADAQGNAHGTGNEQNVNRSGDGVRHASAGFAGRLGNLGQEGPVDGADPLVDQIAEDRSQWQQHQDHGSDCRHRDHEIQAAPPQADGSV